MKHCKQSSIIVIVYMYISCLIVSFNQMLLFSLDNMIQEYIELVILLAKNYRENLKSQTQICNYCFIEKYKIEVLKYTRCAYPDFARI